MTGVWGIKETINVGNDVYILSATNTVDTLNVGGVVCSEGLSLMLLSRYGSPTVGDGEKGIYLWSSKSVPEAKVGILVENDCARVVFRIDEDVLCELSEREIYGLKEEGRELLRNLMV